MTTTTQTVNTIKKILKSFILLTNLEYEYIYKSIDAMHIEYNRQRPWHW